MTIAFVILAAVCLISAAMVVLTRNPVVSAMWLALTLSAVAGVFIVLGAHFLAAIQLIVYAGAILVFFLFVIMLLNLSQLPPGDERHLQRWFGLYMALVILAVIGLGIYYTSTWGTPGEATQEAIDAVGNTEAVAAVLFRDYLFAFELTSVLLTAAVVGAVVLAQRRRRA